MEDAAAIASRRISVTEDGATFFRSTDGNAPVCVDAVLCFARTLPSMMTVVGEVQTRHHAREMEESMANAEGSTISPDVVTVRNGRRFHPKSRTGANLEAAVIRRGRRLGGNNPL